MMPQHLQRAYRGQEHPAHAVVDQISYLIQHLAATQEGGIVFVWDTLVGPPLPTHVLEIMGPSTVLNAPKCGSGAHRPTRILQNLPPKEDLDEAYSNLNYPPHTVNDILEHVGLSSWRMPTRDTISSTANATTLLPRFRTRPTPPPPGELGPTTTIGLLVKDGTLRPPSPEVREILMGFTSGDTEATGLTPAQRNYILGQCSDLNRLHWTISRVGYTSRGHHAPCPREHPEIPRENNYTFSQPLPNFGETNTLPTDDAQSNHASP